MSGLEIYDSIRYRLHFYGYSTPLLSYYHSYYNIVLTSSEQYRHLYSNYEDYLVKALEQLLIDREVEQDGDAWFVSQSLALQSLSCKVPLTTDTTPILFAFKYTAVSVILSAR